MAFAEVPIFTATDLETEKTGELKMESNTNPFESPILQATFNVIRYITVISLSAAHVGSWHGVLCTVCTVLRQ